MVANSSRHARVRDGEQGFVEEVGIFVREFHGCDPWFEFGLEVWVGKFSGCVRPKGTDKDGFDSTVMGVGVVLFGKAPSISQEQPSSRLIAGASIAAGVYEGFGKVDWVAVSCFPVIGQASYIEAKNA